VIAAIAEDRLNDKAYKECERLLAIGGTEKTKGFLAASVWADDTKTAENGPWHYINLPLRLDGKPVDMKPAEENVVWAITHFSEILKDKSKPDAERADALRYIIHFVGDIHQPLHAATLVSDEHPTGDKGGNDYPIKTGDNFLTMEKPPTNLHFLWDMGAGIFKPDSETRPLNAESSARMHLQGQQIVSRFPEGPLKEQIKNLNPMDWANESFRTAQDFAYKVRTGGEIDIAYAAIARTMCAQRAALAGYRLAALLNKLVG
jgi:hypothetical protein